MNNLLKVSSSSHVAYLERTAKVGVIRASDFPGWQSVLLDQENDPVPHMQVERQQRNDCQGNACANGEERRVWYCTGEMPQLSEMFAYNASEFISGPRYVGRDQGTTIQSGVQLLTEGIPELGVSPGLPLERDWPYNQYFKSPEDFAGGCDRLPIEKSMVTQHGALPDWEGMLVSVAAGGSGHIGTYWGVRWSQVAGRRCMSSPPTRGGGHATEIIWAHKINHEWYLVVWNSHGDGFYYMNQKTYEYLQRKQFSPFGGYVLLPDRAQERYDRIYSGGGYY